jgi:hypothetical protein
VDGAYPVPEIEPSTIPDTLTAKLCLQTELDVSYEISQVLYTKISELFASGMDKLNTRSVEYTNLVKSVPPANELKIKLATERGFDVSKPYHPLAFFFGVKHHYSKQDREFGMK